jgi:hypothetical protein
MSPNIYSQPNNVYSNAKSFTLTDDTSKEILSLTTDTMFKSDSFNQFTTNDLIEITDPTGGIYDAS